MSQESAIRFNTGSSIPVGKVAWGVGIIAAALYLLTMNHTFGFVDKGEMAAVASTLGIAHPTGYPTITILGYIFTLLLPGPDVLALNILATLLTAAGAGVMVVLFDNLLGRIAADREGKPSTTGRRSAGWSGRSLTAGAAALFTVLTGFWWQQAVGFEVYALHTLFIPLLTLLFLRYVDVEEASQNPGFSRAEWWFAVVLGLSFTNHLTTILLAPAFLFYYIRRLGLNGNSLKRLPYLIPGVLVGLLPYLYLPIRAAADPALNWGDPDTLGRFLDHVLGAQYQVWMFSDLSIFFEQTGYFITTLPANLGYLGLALLLAGLFRPGRSRTGRTLNIVAWLLFLTCVIYSGGYAIKEIEPYYLTALFAIGIWALLGLAWLKERIGENGALGLALLAATLNAVLHFGPNNESDNTMAEDVTYNMLTTLPPNAVVFSSRWDFWVSGSLYMQQVEQVRPDVLVINPNSLYSPTYLADLQRRAPRLFRGATAEVKHFLAESKRFEEGDDYSSLDSSAYAAAYMQMVNRLIDGAASHRPVHVTGEVRPEIGGRFLRVPYYLTEQLTTDSSYRAQDFPMFRFSFWDGRVDVDAVKLCEFYTVALLNRGRYEAGHGYPDLANRYARYALGFNPNLSVDQVPALPLNNEALVKEVIENYARLQAAQ